MFCDVIFRTIFQAPRSWFKGADTTAVLYFLQDFWGTYKSGLPQPDEYVDSIEDCCRSANVFLSTLYGSGLFLDLCTTRKVAQAGLDFLRSYSECAQLAYNRNRMRFKITPKLHAMIHMTDNLVQACISQRRRTYNLLAESTQMDEDFIGKVSALSRAVSTKVCHMETMSRYMVNVWLHLQGKI